MFSWRNKKNISVGEISFLALSMMETDSPYKRVHYKTILDITWFKGGIQKC